MGYVRTPLGASPNPCGGAGWWTRRPCRDRALGATAAGDAFRTGAGAGCAEGSHPVQVVGTDLWVCEPDGGEDVFSVATDDPRKFLTCPVGYIPQEIPAGSGNWVCVAGSRVTWNDAGEEQRGVSLVDEGAPITVKPVTSTIHVEGVPIDPREHGGDDAAPMDPDGGSMHTETTALAPASTGGSSKAGLAIGAGILALLLLGGN